MAALPFMAPLKFVWTNKATAQVLGLWGMGGIGKTTLAAKLCNGQLPSFGDAACFLGNVRAEAKHAGGLVKLQQKLVKALSGSHNTVEDVDIGMHINDHQAYAVMHIHQDSPLCGSSRGCVHALDAQVWGIECALPVASCTYFLSCSGRGRLLFHLKRRKVLVVIDDTDDHSQIDNLLPPCELHHESLVIITSRNKAICYKCCTDVAEVQLFPKGRDLQLFKDWAFAAGPPVQNASELVLDMVACCGRLPLTLKVGFPHALYCASRYCMYYCIMCV